jgi:(S)-3,5-dihydroxyphenylglycine transaminase
MTALAQEPVTRLASRSSVMRFLNEVADDYPNAISFASGRPADAFFDLRSWLATVPEFEARFGSRRLGQYGNTAGIINDLVAEQLGNDEQVLCTPDRVLITAGCQEAIALCLQALCRNAGDVLAVRNPTYIGATGIADLAGIGIVAIDHDESAASLQAAALRMRAQGKRIRAFYVIPQFDNPTGTVMPLAERQKLLDVCAAERIVILEDNPYGLFGFEGPGQPPLAALDEQGCVIYLATYSKTFCPAVRVGCAVVPETLFGDRDAARALYEELVGRKSFFAVNTSQLNQALVGGVLREERGTLARLIEAPRAFYRRNRDALLEQLQLRFGALGAIWNRPAGGFFLTLELPYAFEANDVVRCAADSGVIVMPMSFFALDDSQRHRVRLAFSNLTPEEIARGIEALAQYQP